MMTIQPLDDLKNTWNLVHLDQVVRLIIQGFEGSCLWFLEPILKFFKPVETLSVRIWWIGLWLGRISGPKRQEGKHTETSGSPISITYPIRLKNLEDIQQQGTNDIVTPLKEWRHYQEENTKELGLIVYTKNFNLENFMTTKKPTQWQGEWADTVYIDNAKHWFRIDIPCIADYVDCEILKISTL